VALELKSKWRKGDFGLGLTNDGNPPVGPGFLILALAGGVLGVGPEFDLDGDEVLVMPPLNDGCVCTRPCVACCRGLVKCEFHHEADVD
jgi:hypothetical protein